MERNCKTHLLDLDFNRDDLISESTCLVSLLPTLLRLKSKSITLFTSDSVLLSEIFGSDSGVQKRRERTKEKGWGRKK